MSNIITLDSITIDFERLKTICVNNYSGIGKTNFLIIEFNARIEYSKNPFTNEIERHEITDKIEKEYPDYETAKLIQADFNEYWSDYMASKLL